MNKKLKMIDMQIKKAKLDQDKLKSAGEEIGTGEGQLLDRNELMAQVLEQAKKTETK